MLIGKQNKHMKNMLEIQTDRETTDSQKPCNTENTTSLNRENIH